MTTLKQSRIQTVDASDDPTVPKSVVTQFIQRNIALSITDGGIEKTTLDFENNSIEANFKYLSSSDKGNPLVTGLRKIDAMSRVVSGKSRMGMNQFNELPNITVNKIQTSTAEELVPFILSTLQMSTPVNEGRRLGLGNALGFSILSRAIAQELKRGGEIYNKFIADVKASGQDTITEWINSGGR